MKNIIYCLVFFSSSVFSQQVIRGPYMQKVTDNSIIIKWRTDVATNSRVVFGIDETSLTNDVTLQNNVTDHTVQLSGLTALTEYYYAVGNSAQILSGPQNHRFRTHPLNGESAPVRVWAIGDFGKGNTEQVDVKNSYETYSDTVETNVWIWLGDNVYDDGKDSEYQTRLFELNGFKDVFNRLPFWPSPGNHDYNEVWEQSALFGIPYSNIPLNQHEGPYFDMVDVPQQGEAGGFPSQLEVFYSFDYGDVHFLSLNSELWDLTQTLNGINQMKTWIEQDLNQNDKTFTIAYFHQPPYSKGSHDSDDAYELVMKAMREHLIPLLESYDVDLVVCGHSHVFERSHLVHGHYGNSSTLDPSTMIKDGAGGNFDTGNPYIKDNLPQTEDGTVYVVCGNSGSKTSDATLDHPVMYFSDGGSDVCGSFVMDINRNRLDGKYLRSNGQILDEFTILKKNLEATSQVFDTICAGESLTLISSTTGGSDNLSYEWSFSTAETAEISVSPFSDITYTVTVTDEVTGQQVLTSYFITVESCTNLLSENDKFFSVYPNPANDVIRIKSEQAFEDIEIYSIDGKCELRQKSNKKSINLDVSALDSGTYILSIRFGNQILQKKVVISR
jgi:hypothetical protein